MMFDIDLAEVCITSNAMVTNDDAPANAFKLADVPGVAVVVEKALGTKCARSWKILPTVGEDPEYPDVSPRDAQALREWKALAEGDKPVDAVEAPAEPVGLIDMQQPEQAPLEAMPEPAASESETATKPARKVRAKKISAATQVDEAESAGGTRKIVSPSKAAEANAPAEAKAKKAKAGKSKAKKAAAKKAKAKKAKTKKAAGRKSKAKATKSGKASSAAKGTRKRTAKAAAKKAAKKKAGKKAGRKSAAAKTKKSKKKAR
jgi:isoleucyl-tRNA synthetase